MAQIRRWLLAPLFAALFLLTVPASQVSARWPYLLNSGPLDTSPTAVAFDTAGNSYFAGTFSGTINVGGMNFVAAGQRDILVVKLDFDGDLVWARVAGSAGLDDASGLALDAAGDVYITGSLCLPATPGNPTCNAAFGQVGTVLVSGSAENVYVAKLTSAGVWQWVRTATATAPGVVRTSDVAVSGGDVFVAGHLRGSLSATDGGGFSIASRASRTDAFFAKLSGAGQWSATKTFPAAGGGAAIDNDDFFADSLAVQNGQVISVARTIAEIERPDSATTAHGPVYTLPGGGSCSVSGTPSLSGGATVTCSGINLEAHDNIYFGIKNDTDTNGITMNGTGPSGNAVFRFANSTANTLTYESSTTVGNLAPNASSSESVTARLNLTRVTGSLAVVDSGQLVNNTRGDVEKLFRVASSSFTVDVDLLATSATRPGYSFANPHVFDPIFTQDSGATRLSRSSVDLAFYYTDSSRLVTLSTTDLTIQSPTGIDLGFVAETVAGNGATGIAISGYLHSGRALNAGNNLAGPGIAVARYELTNDAGPLAGVWASKADGAAFASRLTFGPAADTVYATAGYRGEVFFTPYADPLSTLQIGPVNPNAPGTDDDALVAALDDATGEWVWATRVGGTGADRATDIAIDSATPDPNVVVVGTYVAPAAFGNFDYDGGCVSQCLVRVGTNVELQACSPLNEEALCVLEPCPISSLCLAGANPPSSTSFAGKLVDEGEEGDWLQPVERWVVGEEVPRPEGTADQQPSIMVEGTDQGPSFFYWSAHQRKLFAARPTELKATVSWRKSGGQAGNIIVEGVVRWPDNPQVHMATAPVDVELRGNRCPAASSKPFATCTTNADCGGQVCGPLNAASTWTFGSILFRSGDSDAAVDANKVFTASAGRAVLLMVNGPTQNAENANVALVVVRTLDPRAVVSGQESCTIGSAITNNDHKDPNGKNGWVVNTKSFYDGVGADAAYVRDASRSGPIIPVNLQRNNVDDDEMLVTWYRQDERGIAWPQRTILYDCRWPANPDSIVVISGLGSDGRCSDERGACQSDDDCGSGSCIVQPPLNPQQFPSARIYNQPDPNLAGFNPNEEHALLLPSNAGTGTNAVFALRTDLNATHGHSESYVLLKHRDPTTQQWKMRVYGVSISDDVYGPSFAKRAGSRIDAPYPLNLFEPCSESCAPLELDCQTTGPQCVDSTCVGGSLDGEACTTADDCRPACLENGTMDALCSGAKNLPLFKDHLAIGDDGNWKGWWARSPGTITARQHYPIQPGFFTDFDLDGSPNLALGTCEPWLVSDGTQAAISYGVSWPADIPTLRIGETLLEPKNGLPAISSQAAVEVVFETTSQAAAPPNQSTSLVRLIDPLSPRSVPLATLPTDVVSVRIGPRSRVTGGQNGDVKLSPGVSARIIHDSNAGVLSYTGVFDETGLGEPLLMLNVMTDRERDELKNLSTEPLWDAAVDALYDFTRNPNAVDQDGNMEADKALRIGLTMDGNMVVREKLLGDKALTAGLAADTGYVTLAFNNDPTLAPLPISLEVIKIDCAPYQGQIQVIPSSNVFDEQVTVRHSGDFAGDPGSLDFEWYYALKEQDCQSIPVPQYPQPVGAPWIPAPRGNGRGIVDVTLSGPGVTSLADTCFIARYKGYSICNNETVPSQWAGAPLGPTSPNDPRAQLVPGWLTRVTEGLNPFDQRTSDFRNNEVETLANLLVSAGERFEGPVAFNPDADAINNVGLIEIYQSVLRRGEDLSINEGISVGAVNSKLLDVAARISDLYMALGNEAFGDALDPTIGFDTAGRFGTAAPSIFAFQDQTSSLLAEELSLLRGRDDTGGAPPVYNRLIWNFTGRDGQVAYQQNYNISNQDGDADIDEFDARILFPQGHGDAWGHYLTALKGYYMLLRHPNFVWLPRSDSVLVAGSEVLVDFTDERRFATSAAARARTGAQIVDLTYRQRWVDDPAGQWQGYKDTDGDRAFGVSDWAQRAGQGALFDWVVANAILPPQSDAPPGIQKIDRTTVPELREITAQSSQVQAQLDLVDGGVNPLGVAKNAVPFDIDPTFLQVSSTVQGLSHYEQIADRAGAAMANAVRVFNHANGLTELLRRTQDTAVEFARNIAAEERDYNNRLIEIFGSPYPEDIGPGRTYKVGYRGPDVWNWDLAEPSEINGLFPAALADVSEYTLAVRSPDFDDCASNEGTCRFDNSGKLKYDDDGKLLTIDTSIDVQLSNRGFGKVKNPAWSVRESPGELQLAQSELLQARASFEQAVQAYSKLILDIECVISTIQGQNQLAEDRLVILNRVKNTKLTFNALIFAAKGIELGLKRVSQTITDFSEVGITSLPKVVGLATDAFSGPRAAVKATGIGATLPLGVGADAAELSQLAFEQATEIEAQIDGLAVQGLENDFQIFNLLGDLGQKTREEPVRRIEALGLAEKVRQSEARLRAVLARGVRLIDELEAFRKRTATNVADSRYSDMAFRIFRNDALQKYRAQLDLAARYVYLSAAAYDYETNLSGTDARAGRRFLTDIVRQRSLGQFVDGEPVAGSPGLGNVLAQMNANFSVLKGQLGFNNPQNETNRFSLRRELFRILDDSNDTWRSALASHRVENLWTMEEFRRFARPPRAEADGPLPGIVIPIPTSVTFGLNFFGWPLAGGDSAYDPTNFATKVRTMGVWFGNYNAQGLSNTPRVYLIPAGADVLRTPTAGDLRTRNWTVLDQRIPVPFPIGQSALDDPAWSPQLDSLSEPLGGVRQFSSFRAFHDSGSFSTNQVTTDSRAIGRSVWNTRWLLIVTGGTLLADAEEGLDTFIYGRPAPSGSVIDPDGVKRDGSGISDVLLFFQTYALSGN